MINPFKSTTEYTVNPKLNNKYELRKLISENIKRSIGHVFGMTKKWSEKKLRNAYYESEKSEMDFWIYRNQTNE